MADTVDNMTTMPRTPPIDARPTRRQLLKAGGSLAALTVAQTLTGCASAPRRRSAIPPKVVLVRFGGGVRADDVFGEPKCCLAPGVRALAAQGTVFTQIWNENLTRHDAATLHLLTGCYGRLQTSTEHAAENLATLRQRPTLFEAFRKSGKRGPTRALAAGMPPLSGSPDFGPQYRALSFGPDDPANAGQSPSGDPSLGSLPHRALCNERLARLSSQLAHQQVPAATGARHAFVFASALADLAKNAQSNNALDAAVAQCMADRLLAERPFIRAAESDEWLVDLTIETMRTLRPDLVGVALSTPDLAHRGAWRSYAAGVAQVDLQLGRLAAFIDRDPYYRGETLLVVTPDCGRGDPDFTGHEAPFDSESHRRLFLVARGRGLPAGRVRDARCSQIDVAPTLAELLECDLKGPEGGRLAEMLA